uniref:GAE domain-containing protein n=1 Tax=Hanusia phi TaxID=3032 RepID=A0A7S0HSM8_9CRYP|mmetsp:Transcript_3174/g.7632  ORF Transcript_3174/g.7632 Transcript_3174/m.7632 type:complete len:125 (+) Transcript_3174:198-572(+)
MATTHKGSSTRRDLNYPDPLNGIKVMIEFARPSHDIMIVNVTFMNQKANALTDFNSTPVVPDYVDVDASGFASNFLPGNNQGFLQQKITMKNNAMANGKPFKLQLRLSYVDGGQRGQVSFEVRE